MALEGRPLVLGRREFIVPDPSIDVAERVMLGLKNLGDGADAFAQFDAFTGIVLAALADNYPELTAAELKKCIPARFDKVIKPLCEALNLGKDGDTGEAPSP